MCSSDLFKKLPYDPVADFAPVGRVAVSSYALAINPERLPARDFAEFLSLVKAKPGQLNYGTPGNGTSPHIATEVFNREAKTKLNHVPYKGAGPALNDLLGGQIQLAFDPGVGLNAARSGKLRMVAIAGPARNPEFPDVPTLEEKGIKGVDGGPHFGFFAPAAAPREAIEKLNREVIRAMKEPVVLERFKALAVNIAEPMTPDQFAAYVRAQSARYGKLLPELNIGQ